MDEVVLSFSVGAGEREGIGDPKSDLENETHFPFCHCEHLKGACLHAEVLVFVEADMCS